MATTVAGSGGRYSNLRRQRDPFGVRVYGLVLTTVFFVALAVLVIVRPWPWSGVEAIVAFASVAAVADAMRFRPWPEMSFALSAPVVLAAAMVLQPTEAAIVGFLSIIDLRAWRREVPVSRALFNRAEVGLSALGASIAFHALTQSVTAWPRAFPAALACLFIDVAVNISLVAWPAAQMHGSTVREVLGGMFGPKYLAKVAHFLSVALMAPLIAVVWQAAGIVGLAMFLLPIGLAWSVLQQADELRSTHERLEAQNEALARAVADVAAERTDERLALAGELHDGVLPALFAVHLLGQVLRQDLATGQLLQLESDIPRLVDATDRAQETVRSLMGAARASALGPTGLAGAIRGHADRVEMQTGVRVMVDVDEVDGPEPTLFVIFQVAREAVSNATVHSGASLVTVRLLSDAEKSILTVRDDGIGFDPRVATPRHYGLSLMRERAVAVGGELDIDSIKGEGTTITLTIRRQVGLAG